MQRSFVMGNIWCLSLPRVRLAACEATWPDRWRCKVPSADRAYSRCYLRLLCFLCALKPLLLLSSALFCLLQMTTNAIYVLYQYGLDPLHYYFEDPEDRPAFSVCVFALHTSWNFRELTINYSNSQPRGELPGPFEVLMRSSADLTRRLGGQKSSYSPAESPRRMGVATYRCHGTS